MDLKINNSDTTSIEKSFDRIAGDLLRNYGIKVNDEFLRFSEIEFYYFDENHQDKYTPRHTRLGGEWRVHRKGLDITFKSNEKKYGGVLIRGVYDKAGNFINGPFLVLNKIFTCLGKTGKKSTVQFLKSFPVKKRIIKARRHGLNSKTSPVFYRKKYRYLTDLNKISLSKKDRESIKAHSEEL